MSKDVKKTLAKVVGFETKKVRKSYTYPKRKTDKKISLARLKN